MFTMLADFYEDLRGIDAMITGLARQGIVSGPKVDLLKHRRRMVQINIRNVEEALKYGR